MTRWLSILTGLLLISANALAQPQAPDTLWTRVYDQYLYPTSIRTTSDGGCVLTCTGQSGSHLLLIKLNQTGDIEWTYADSSLGYASSSDILITPDGNYVIIGITTMIGDTNQNIVIEKITSAGILEWSRVFGGLEDEWGSALTRTADGGFMIVGRVGSIQNGDVLCIRLTANGDSISSRRYSASYSQSGYRILATVDGGFAIAVRDAPLTDYLFRLNSDGDTLWTRAYSDYVSTPDTMRLGHMHDFCITPDGSHVFLGHGMLPDYQTWLLRADSIGNVIWQRVIGNQDYDSPEEIRLMPDGGFVMAGRTLTSTDPDFSLLRTNANGDSIWSAVYDLGGREEAWTFDTASDGGYTLAGWQWTIGGFHLLIMRMGPEGLAADDPVNPLPLSFDLSAYPNPFNPSTTITFNLPQAKHVSLMVFDVTGRMVIELADERFLAGSHSVAFNGSDLPSGIYFARLNAGNVQRIQKMVLLK